MYSGNLNLSGTSIFKDQRRYEQDHPQNVIKDQEKIYQKNVYLFHILFIVPILAYVGVQGYRKKLKNTDWYILLVVISMGALLYHGYRFFNPRETHNLVTGKI
jgi:hypothetical protein